MKNLIKKILKEVYYDSRKPLDGYVDAEDLIVNNNATDLSNAKRITHRIYMRQSVVKRMQIIGAYMDVELDTPMEGKTDSLKEEKKSQQGIKPNTMRCQNTTRKRLLNHLNGVAKKLVMQKKRLIHHLMMI